MKCKRNRKIALDIEENTEMTVNIIGVIVIVDIIVSRSIRNGSISYDIREQYNVSQSI